MMKNRQSGQAFILVIIVLALGALLVGPALRLTSTTLLSSVVTDRKTKQLYAADAGQEYVMWMLLYKNYGSTFTADGQEDHLPPLIVNNIPVDLTVIMRAVVGAATHMYNSNFTIRPTKTVSPSTVPDGSLRTYTYTIKLENLTPDNQTLERVYDILPKDFGTGKYVAGSSQIRVDGGAWQALANPLAVVYSSQDRLCWPNSGNFTSPFKDFAPLQVKEIKFQVRGTLGNNATYYNWVVLQPNAVSTGPVAPIVTGTGALHKGGGLVVEKTAVPQLAVPGVETDVFYTITITNLDGNTQSVASVTDYLPPEFYYIGPTSGTPNLTTQNPSTNQGTYNGVVRWRLVWANFDSSKKSIASGASKQLTFWARTTPNVSGAYYNEVVVGLDNWQDLNIFQSIGVNQSNASPYSWNSGVVIVPSYDSRSVAVDTTIDTNLGLALGNIAVTSWVAK